MRPPGGRVPPRPDEDRRRSARDAGPGRVLGIVLDYPVRPRARYGWGAPFHTALDAIIEPGDRSLPAVLEGFLVHRVELRRRSSRRPAVCHRDPQWLERLHPGARRRRALLVRRRPAACRPTSRSGSGNSTKFVRRAIRDHSLIDHDRVRRSVPARRVRRAVRRGDPPAGRGRRPRVVRPLRRRATCSSSTTHTARSRTRTRPVMLTEVIPTPPEWRARRHPRHLPARGLSAAVG